MALIKLLVAKQKMEKGKESLKESFAAVKKETGLDKTADKVVQKVKMENVLIVRMRSYSMGTMAATLLGAAIGTAVDGGKGQYQIVTKDGVEVFASDMETTLLTDRDIMTIYDTSNGKRKIGSIK